MNQLKRVFPFSIPVLMGYIPLGIGFGYLFVNTGGAIWQAVFLSVFAFAGAMQYLAISLFSAGVSFSTLAVMTLVINGRHIFYGLSLLDEQPKAIGLKLYAIFALTDETYSLRTSLKKKLDKNDQVLLSFLNHLWWIIGSFIGAVLGRYFPTNAAGLEFSLTALFIVLCIEQTKNTGTMNPILYACISFSGCYYFFQAQALILSIFITAILLLIEFHYKKK
ncbi:branched-chain amino acid ABC transporter permease [Gammaproteobacteria bacterium]|nr:branched-chain amino acid ABC transporter permease [Gammaproteobacteria bacterium]